MLLRDGLENVVEPVHNERTNHLRSSFPPLLLLLVVIDADELVGIQKPVFKALPDGSVFVDVYQLYD